MWWLWWGRWLLRIEVFLLWLCSVRSLKKWNQLCMWLGVEGWAAPNRKVRRSELGISVTLFLLYIIVATLSMLQRSMNREAEKFAEYIEWNCPTWVISEFHSFDISSKPHLGTWPCLPISSMPITLDSCLYKLIYLKRATKPFRKTVYCVDRWGWKVKAEVLTWFIGVDRAKSSYSAQPSLEFIYDRKRGLRSAVVVIYSIWRSPYKNAILSTARPFSSVHIYMRPCHWLSAIYLTLAGLRSLIESVDPRVDHIQIRKTLVHCEIGRPARERTNQGQRWTWFPCQSFNQLGSIRRPDLGSLCNSSKTIK